jgi:hypothetical protein
MTQRKDVLAGGAIRHNFGSMTGVVTQEQWDRAFKGYNPKKKFRAKRGRKPKVRVCRGIR